MRFATIVGCMSIAVIDDGVADTLFGSAGQDWFWAGSNDPDAVGLLPKGLGRLPDGGIKTDRLRISPTTSRVAAIPSAFWCCARRLLRRRRRTARPRGRPGHGYRPGRRR